MSSPAPLSSQAITARSGSNLALAFICLPPERRRAMSIFYAYCRVIDDAADSETLTLAEKKKELDFWREEIRRAYLSTPESPLGRELAEIIRTYLIPPTPLEEILQGVEMDLHTKRYETFAELEKYCYRVASAVGLVSIEIFSYRQPQTRDYAIALGLAFQLTNILRDVAKDAANDRIYLPLEELRRWGLTEADVLEGRNSATMQQFLRFQYHRAKHYFAKSLRLIHPEDRPNLGAAEIMREVYEELLEKIHRDGFQLRNPPLRLNKAAKAYLIWRAQRREKQAAPLPPRPKSVLVLGGGWAGLSAAMELTRRGHQVALLESRGQLGGRAHSFREAQSGEIVDNGQHILMGCYPATLRFLDDLGVRHKIYEQPVLHVPFRSARGTSQLLAWTLPAPFHLLGGLIQFAELSWPDRWAALRLGLALRFSAPPPEEETAAAWLQRLRQPANLVRALWEPMCLAALNQSLAQSSARLLVTVLQRALFGSTADSKLMFSRVGLSDLISPEFTESLTVCGGTIHLKTQVQKLNWSANRLESVTTLDGRTFTADHIVSALPWNALRPLLPPDSSLARICQQIPDSTIVSVYLWLDRPLPIPMVLGFLDSPLHWLFSREEIEGHTHAGRHLYVAVISAADALADQTPEALLALTVGELHRFIPEAKAAQVKHQFVYKAKSATFRASPAVEKIRPLAATEWNNFWIAGDWTNTGLPATIEGAVWSGQRAAEALDL